MSTPSSALICGPEPALTVSTWTVRGADRLRAGPGEADAGGDQREDAEPQLGGRSAAAFGGERLG